MKSSQKKVTVGISFPDPKVLELAKLRAGELGIRSFSEYINQLIRCDVGLPNYISAHVRACPRHAVGENVAASGGMG